MIPTRGALAIPALIMVLAGCGAVSAITLHATTDSVAFPDAAPHTVRPSLAPAPQPSTAPVNPGSNGVLVATIPFSGSEEWLEILTPSGAVVARTEIDPTDPWLTRAGAGGAYWTQGGIEHELTPSGAVRSLGAVPADANGVVIGPDGVSFAYATSDQLHNGSLLNRIVVIHPGSAADVIADRVSDSNHPTADAPSSWDYYLIGWTAPGIAFARVPYGGCGCGSFDMQMQSAFSALIDPTSGDVTTLTADTSCPLSSIGPGLETVCFAGTTATTAVEIASAGRITHTYSLSGANLAGDAVFAATGNLLAYATIPASEDTCGATLTPILRVLNLETGSATSRNIGNFTPVAWAPDAAIYGQMVDGSGSWLAAVDPTTLAVTRLSTTVSGAELVGIV
jgi:hypothetical protein